MTVRTFKELEDTIQTKMKESKHTLAKNKDNPNRYACTVCNDSFVKSDSAFQHWLAVGCLSIPHGNRPLPVDIQPHIGNKCTHSSHKMGKFRDIIFCTKCGSIGRHHINKLSLACGPPGPYGKNVLKYIKAGRMPPASDTNTFAHRNIKSINKYKRKYEPARKTLSYKRMSVSKPLVPQPDLLPTIIPLSSIPGSFRNITNFDDSEVEIWQEEDEDYNEAFPPGSDMEEESYEAEPPLLINIPSVTVIPTPVGFCPECGDSLTTLMHVTSGPCCSVIPHLIPATIQREIEQPRPARTAFVRVYNSDDQGGFCAGCGDSLSTPMHIANGPCI
jgi:hypothetical protein